MVSVVVSHLREKCSKGSSLMTRWTVKATSSMRMDPCMKVCGQVGRRTAKEGSIGLMDSSMKANSKTTSVTAREHSTILVGRSSKDSGRMERRMADASIHGLMERNITSYILTGRSRARVS